MQGGFLIAGYRLVKPVERPQWMDGSLPDVILSASGCICDTVPDSWAYDWSGAKWADRAKSAATLGVIGRELRGMAAWCADAFSRGLIVYPEVFKDIRWAREFARRFGVDRNCLCLIGLGFSEGLQPDLLHETREIERRKGANRELKGLVEERRGMEPGGEILGFEVLGLDLGTFHSWLCNGLEKPVLKDLGIRTGRYGLIAEEGEAEQVAAYCNRDDVASEPVCWHPFLLVKYDW